MAVAARNRIAPFDPPTLEAIAKTLADTERGLTGTPIEHKLRQCQIPDVELNREPSAAPRVTPAFSEEQVDPLKAARLAPAIVASGLDRAERESWARSPSGWLPHIGQRRLLAQPCRVDGRGLPKLAVAVRPQISEKRGF